MIQGLSEKRGIEFNEIGEYLDLLAVSIGADIVEMTGENRVLAFYGIRVINESPRVGLKALIEKSGKQTPLTITDVVFGIAPRINAAGRIEHGKRAVQLLIETNERKAKDFAEGIENHNTERKELDQNITNEALEMTDDSKKSTVVYLSLIHI